MRDEVRRRATTFRESKWVDTYGRDGAYDSWGMVDITPQAFPAVARALRNAPLAPRRKCIARQRADRSIHAHSAAPGPDVPHHAGGARPHGRGRQRLDWTPGEATVCDTTFFHSTHNEHPTGGGYPRTSTSSTRACRPTSGMRWKRFVPPPRGGAAAARRGAVAVRSRGQAWRRHGRTTRVVTSVWRCRWPVLAPQGRCRSGAR